MDNTPTELVEGPGPELVEGPGPAGRGFLGKRRETTGESIGETSVQRVSSKRRHSLHGRFYNNFFHTRHHSSNISLSFSPSAHASQHAHHLLLLPTPPPSRLLLLPSMPIICSNFFGSLSIS